MNAEQIQEYLAQIKNKRAFIIKAAKAFDKKPSSLSTSWFSRFFIVPENYHEKLKELFETEIANQHEQSTTVN